MAEEQKKEQGQETREEQKKERGQAPEADFSFFITSLAMQASIALGQMPNPMNQKLEENLDHARLIIDTISMLREKTRGNLSAEEDSLIDNFLYELRMYYLARTKAKPEADKG